MWFAKFFSHSVSNILILLMISFAIQNRFRLVLYHLFIFAFFLSLLLVSYTKKIINKINVKEHIAYILFYDFRSYIQVFNSFKLIFLCSVSGPALFYFISLSVFSILLAWNNFFLIPSL